MSTLTIRLLPLAPIPHPPVVSSAMILLNRR